MHPLAERRIGEILTAPRCIDFRLAGGLEVFHPQLVLARLELHLALGDRRGGMDAVGLDHLLPVDREPHAVVARDGEGVFAVLGRGQLAGIDDAELVLVIVELDLDLLPRDLALAMRRERREVRQLLPIPEKQCELQRREPRPRRGDFHLPLHAHRMAGEGADIGIAARLVRCFENDLVLRLRCHRLRVRQHPRIDGQPVALHRLLGLLHVLGRHRHDIRAGLEEHEVVRHVVEIFENDAHVRAGAHGEFRHIVAHLRRGSLDGDNLRLSRGGSGGEEGEGEEGAVHGKGRKGQGQQVVRAGFVRRREEHPTLNIQHPTSNEEKSTEARSPSLDVGC